MSLCVAVVLQCIAVCCSRAKSLCLLFLSLSGCVCVDYGGCVCLSDFFSVCVYVEDCGSGKSLCVATPSHEHDSF